MKKKYDYTSTVALYEEAKNERLEYEAEWRQISDYLLPRYNFGAQRRLSEE